MALEYWWDEHAGEWVPLSSSSSGGGMAQADADARYLKQVADKAEPTILFTDPTNNRVAEIEIRNDGSTTTNWPDRFGFRYYNGTASTRTGGFNEYGEGRFDAAKTTTVPLRAHGNGLAAHSANLFECRVSRAGATVFSVAANGTVTTPADISARWVAAAEGGDFGGFRVTSVGTPTHVADAANKAYVDARIWQGTQAEYDAIAVKDQTVLYVII